MAVYVVEITGKKITVDSTYWANKKGTAKRKCKCNSWKEHWQNISKEKWPAKCAVKGCKEKPDDGAHTYQTQLRELDQREFIAPLCHKHNMSNDKFSLRDGTILVPANQFLTCKK